MRQSDQLKDRPNQSKEGDKLEGNAKVCKVTEPHLPSEG